MKMYMRFRSQKTYNVFFFLSSSSQSTYVWGSWQIALPTLRGKCLKFLKYRKKTEDMGKFSNVDIR